MGWLTTTYPFNSGPLSADATITGPDPGLILQGSETNAVYQVVREIAGQMWILTNCDLNKTTGNLVQTVGTAASFGLALNTDGSMVRYKKNIGATAWLPSAWDVTIWTLTATGNMVASIGPGWYTGTGVPAFSAANGSMYLRFDGGAGTRLYINQSGASTTGTTWAAIAGS